LHHWSCARIISLQLFLHLYWVASATLGGLLGSLIPDSVHGLDFAMTAPFAVLALDALRNRRKDLATPALALLSVIAASLIVPGQMLPVALALLTGALTIRHWIGRRRTCRA
jgi:branched chain amino acid efflux pump